MTVTHYVLPKLAYDYSALEPAISAQIMELHHSKHHQTYIDKLNAALEEAPELQNESVDYLLRTLTAVPERVRAAVRNNGGGHLNHTFFWHCMTPGGNAMTPAFKVAIEMKYGTVEAFQEQFSARALGLFGSGWCWLMPDLSIVTTPNQDNPISQGDPMPILGLDVWEHAYYLDYKNKRDEYVQNWWKVVDWRFVEAQRAARG